MARKGKNLASFDEVANNNINANVDVNENNNKDVVGNVNFDVNDNVNIDVNNNVNDNGDYLDQIINSAKKKKSFEQKPTGIYLQEDISKILNDLAKKGGRGAKSRIVNEALRAVFTEKGLI